MAGRRKQFQGFVPGFRLLKNIVVDPVILSFRTHGTIVVFQGSFMVLILDSTQIMLHERK